MTKTIYILTTEGYENKAIIGVFDSIELASFAKEQFDREKTKWDKSSIEEHPLNYDCNLGKF